MSFIGYVYQIKLIQLNRRNVRSWHEADRQVGRQVDYK